MDKTYVFQHRNRQIRMFVTAETIQKALTEFQSSVTNRDVWFVAEPEQPPTYTQQEVEDMVELFKACLHRIQQVNKAVGKRNIDDTLSQSIGGVLEAHYKKSSLPDVETEPKECVWTLIKNCIAEHDGLYDAYETGCNWKFNAEKVYDVGYCNKCGKPIKVEGE